MFTGLVQGLAQVQAVQQVKGDKRFTFTFLFKVENLVIGESIAINGTCLTVEKIDNQSVVMFASAETLEHSNLRFLQVQDIVNAERALTVGSSLGGHFVSGHVDSLAIVMEIKEIDQSKFVKLGFPKAYAAHIINKGSVCLDGISLTVNLCTDDYFTVNIIPETWKETTVKNWRIGSKVNLETDVLAKYVEKMLQAKENKKELSLEKLLEAGF